MERSPSAPRLKPSIVNERGDEAPRVKHSALHSPDLASSEEVFGSSQELSASSEEPFAPHSPSLGPHSLPFGSSEEDLEPRDLRSGRHSLASDHPKTSPRPIPRGECHPKRRERRPSSGECHPKSYTDDVPQMSHNPKPRECPAISGECHPSDSPIVRRGGNIAQNPNQSPKNPRVTDTCPDRPTPRIQRLTRRMGGILLKALDNPNRISDHMLIARPPLRRGRRKTPEGIGEAPSRRRIARSPPLPPATAGRAFGTPDRLTPRPARTSRTASTTSGIRSRGG